MFLYQRFGLYCGDFLAMSILVCVWDALGRRNSVLGIFHKSNLTKARFEILYNFYHSVRIMTVLQGCFEYMDECGVLCKLHHAYDHSECCVHAVRTQLQSGWWLYCMLMFIQLFASRALSRCKHVLGTLLWLNAETLKRAPTSPLCKVLRAWTLFHKTKLSNGYE